MNNQNFILLLFFILCILYVIVPCVTPKLETFTNEQQEFAIKLLEFFKSPHSFITYAQFLISNNNTSVNLASKKTYDLLKSNRTLTLNNILKNI